MLKYNYNLTPEKIVLIINYLKESCGVKLEPREEQDMITWIKASLTDGVARSEALAWHINGNFGPCGELRLGRNAVFVASATKNPYVFGGKEDEKYAAKKREIRNWIQNLIEIPSITYIR